MANDNGVPENIAVFRVIHRKWNGCHAYTSPNVQGLYCVDLNNEQAMSAVALTLKMLIKLSCNQDCEVIRFEKMDSEQYLMCLRSLGGRARHNPRISHPHDGNCMQLIGGWRQRVACPLPWRVWLRRAYGKLVTGNYGAEAGHASQ
jgi:hypothetical protein